MRKGDPITQSPGNECNYAYDTLMMNLGVCLVGDATVNTVESHAQIGGMRAWHASVGCMRDITRSPNHSAMNVIALVMHFTYDESRRASGWTTQHR